MKKQKNCLTLRFVYNIINKLNKDYIGELAPHRENS